MEEKSLWTDLEYVEDSPIIEENKIVDILIIGGGIAGLTTAYNLKDSGLNIMLVDANKVGYGVTARTTGKLTYLQETIYTKIKKIYDEKTAKLYYDSQKEAIEFVVKTVKSNNLNCDLKMTKSFVYADKDSKVKNIKTEEKLLKKWGVDVHNSLSEPFLLESQYSIYVNDTYDFHPIKYCNELKKICLKNIDVFEFSRVTKIIRKYNKYQATINDHIVVADYIIVACHYPFFIIPELIPFKSYLEKSYLTATKISKSRDDSAITDGPPYFSFRYYKNKENNYILFLSHAHNLGSKINHEQNYQTHIQNLKQKLNLGYEYLWSNYDVITFDHLPYIGKVKNENIYMATGFNTWGMTNGTAAGLLLSDIVLNKKNKYQKLFSLNRKIIISKFVLNVIRSGIVLAKSKLIFKKNRPRVKISYIDGQKTGIYIDEFNNKHYVKLTCPHFKCGLIFNNITKTWDCPCHGSRFDIEGKIVKGPSTKDVCAYHK